MTLLSKQNKMWVGEEEERSPRDFLECDCFSSFRWREAGKKIKKQSRARERVMASVCVCVCIQKYFADREMVVAHGERERKKL
jgi:hypothetical protein